LFFILPVKAKWLTLFSGVLLLIQFVFGSLDYKRFLLFALFPYFLFFGPYFYKELRSKARVAANRKKFDKDMWR
jgi:hypothetical protein